MYRRKFGLAGLGALAGSLAGCGQLDSVFGGSDTDETPMVENWDSYRGNARRTGRAVPKAGPGESLSLAWHRSADDLAKAADDDIPSDRVRSLTQVRSAAPILADEYLVWTVRYRWRSDDGLEQARQLLAVDTSGSIEWSRTVRFLAGNGSVKFYGPRLDDGELYHPRLPDQSPVVQDIDSDEADDTSSDGARDTLGVTVRDPETGEIERELDLGVSTAGSLLVEDGTVFVAMFTEEPHRLAAYDADSGSEQWSVETPLTYPGYGQFASLYGDTILHTEWNDSEAVPVFVARDIADGSVRWRTPLDVPSPNWEEGVTSFRLPMVGEYVYTSGISNLSAFQMLAPLVALNRDDGSEVFRYRPPGVEDETGFPFNVSRVESEAEEQPPLSGLYGMPLEMDDCLVATGYGAVDGTGDASRCFAIEDESIAWSVDCRRGALVAAGDVIYLASKEGLKAISTEGEVLDSIEPAEHDALPQLRQASVNMMPAIGNGLLYLPTIHGIAAIE